MLPTDAALRAAVAAAPDAALPRLVYADYLDDHDFPHHAAALRLDVALAAERPWADRYWLLKADRDVHTPAGFPGDLGWLSDRSPLLVGVPDDWRSRWRAVRAFVSRWWNAPLGDVGRWGAAVEEAERVTGRELPPGVKEWAAFAAEFHQHSVGHGALHTETAGAVVRRGNAVLLHQQDDPPVEWVWGVREDVTFDGLDPDNPPVLVLDGESGEMYYWLQDSPLSWFSNTTAGFALFYLLSHRTTDWQVADIAGRRNALAASHPHAGRFDLADVYEGPGRVVVLLPPHTHWGETTATLFVLTDSPFAQAGPAPGVPH